MRVWKRLLSLALCASMLLPAGCGRGDGAALYLRGAVLALRTKDLRRIRVRCE